jgi:putative ABC transport system permease protein
LWSILRQRRIIIVSILCLALGFAAFIILMCYVRYETTWDKENPGYNNIYRVNKIVQYQNSSLEFVGNHYPLAAALKAELPEIEESVVIKPQWQEYISVNGTDIVSEKNGFYVSNNIFSIFPYKIIEGDKNNMLLMPNSVVISKSLAEKLYPNQNPVGKTLYNSKKDIYTITGLMEDVPENSQIRPSYLISMITEEKLLNLSANWNRHSNYLVYVLLRNGVSIRQLEKKMNAVFWKHKEKTRESLYLQPLSKLHLEPTRGSDEKYVPIYYSLLAIVILLLACVNFMNLSTILSGKRAREIGILKISGSSRFQLITLFLGEGTLLTFIAFFVAIMMVVGFMPVFNNVIQRSINIDITHNLSFYLLVFGITLLTGILSGLYPAFILSSYKPAKVLKTDANILKNSKSTGHKLAVVFQFFLATVLISVSLWIYHQVNFMKNKSLGYDTKNIVLCKIPDNNTAVDFDNLKNRLLANPLITSVSGSQNTPLHDNWTGAVYGDNGKTDDGIFSNYNTVSHDFIDTYGMKVLKGRNFSGDLAADNASCIINEACAKALGWIDPLGRTIHAGNKKYSIIGVVNDFHQTSLHDKIIPYFMILNDGKLNKEMNLSIKISGNDNTNALEFINKVLSAQFHDVLFKPEYFDLTINDVAMQIWQSAQKVFLFFAFLAISIALFGLYGLVAATTKSRTKEIGVRKVHGSTALQVFLLINKYYFVLLTAAIALALPVLNIMASVAPGAYKYQIQWSDYVQVVIVIYFVALLTSGWHSWRASTRNPVEALRYE